MSPKVVQSFSACRGTFNPSAVNHHMPTFVVMDIYYLSYIWCDWACISEFSTASLTSASSTTALIARSKHYFHAFCMLSCQVRSIYRSIHL